MRLTFLLGCLAAAALSQKIPSLAGLAGLATGGQQECILKRVSCSVVDGKMVTKAEEEECLKKLPAHCLNASKNAQAIEKIVSAAVVDMDKQVAGVPSKTEAQIKAEAEEMATQLNFINEQDFENLQKAIDEYAPSLEDESKEVGQYVNGAGIVRLSFSKAVLAKVIHMARECVRAKLTMQGKTVTEEDLASVNFLSFSALPDKDGKTELEALDKCVHGDDSSKKRRKRQIEINNLRKWRNNQINWMFCRSASDPELRRNVRSSAKYIQDRTCLTFVEQMATDTVFFLTNKPGCTSSVGRQGGAQGINVGHASCYRYSSVAQLWLMTIGLRHTVQRSDRDQYVKVLTQNIETSALAAFEIASSTTTYNLPYELQSLMHPVAKANSKNGQNTVESLLGPDFTATMGSSFGGPTFYDLKLINSHYCPATCPGQTCQNEGYPNPKNCNVCVCPQGYCGDKCERLCDGGPQTCGGSLVAETEWKCINSPNYPEVHAKGQSCVWDIKAPESHMRVEWEFRGDKFGFAYSSAPVCQNYVELRYQESRTRNGQFFCGYSVPQNKITSLRDFIFVNMQNPLFDLNYVGFKGCYRISTVTNTPPDPIDCRLEDWTPWSQCSCSCNGGYRERTRAVIAGPRYGGKTCAELGLKQTETCNTQLCPVDCVVSGFDNWSPCRDTSGAEIQCGKGLQTRSQIILIEASNGGKACPVPDPLDLAKECDLGPCVVNCELYPINSAEAWDAFGECSTTCGPGTWTRRRMVKRLPLNGGKPCDQLGEQMTDTQGCQGNPACPVDCVVGSWVIGQCSASCGPGTATSTRQILTQPANGGRRCPDCISYSDCNQGPCPIDCQMGEWSDYGACTAACGGGSQTRSRSVVRRGAYGGILCPTTADTEVETRQCNTQSCAVDCQISGWSEWSQCDKTCGGGKKQRSRTINVQSANGGAQCPANLNEAVDCNTQGCPVDCVVSDWSAYSTCSKTCGGGLQERTRTVTTQFANGGARCPTDLSETRACGESACPVDCGQGSVVPEGECSKYCGGGVQWFRWIITREPANGGRSCEEVIGGPIRFSLACNNKPCPIPCRLNSWEAWSSCDAECEGGVQRRVRTIRAQPQYDGTPCDQFGLSEERPCNSRPCKDCADIVCEEGEYCAELPNRDGVCLCQDNYRRRYGVCEKMECYCPEP